MSEVGQIDIREQIIRIDRMIAETEKFQAEQRKLISESGKLERDRLVAPWMAIAALLGGALGLATFMARFLGR